MKTHHHLVRSVFYFTAISMAGIVVSCATAPPTAPAPPIASAPSTAPAPQPMSTVAPASQATPGQELGPSSRTQEVKASWYGPSLAGHKTTSGKHYDPEGLTAASKTLPIGSVVKVSNPRNGKSVNVRIDDRGPFVRGRSLDLSHHAAKSLGILHKGVTQVKVQKITPPSAASRSGGPSPQANAGKEDKASDEYEH
jgi:peptidoglycan lytic transglycosylase